MKTTATTRLISSAATRLQLAAAGRCFHIVLLSLAVATALALVASRLLGLFPDAWARPLHLAALPVAALLAAAFFSRKPAPVDAARSLDERAGTKELFLSASLATAEAEFTPVVHEMAEERAGSVKTAALFPFRWVPGARNVALSLAALWAGAAWMPKFDPFRLAQKRVAEEKREQRLAETKRLTEVRKEELKQHGGAVAEQVQQALAKLDKTLKEMKPAERQGNGKKLNDETGQISNLWKNVKNELPKNAAENLERAAQEFGADGQRKEMREMMEKLKSGDATALKQKLDEAIKKMDEIAKTADPADKKRMLEQLAKDLAKTANQMREQAGNKATSDALQRALEQLAMGRDAEQMKEALDAAKESLNLSKEELEQLAQNFKDADKLEDALKNLAKARQLNDQEKLDGKDAEGASTMEDYEALYDKLLAQQGQQGGGQGQGQGQNGNGKSGDNPGIGQGGSVGEDKTAQSKMKDEKSKSQMTAGKLLMQWNENGVGEIGQKSGDYQSAVRAVREGVAEAIRNEQIPPGYHESIQRYFDRLPEKK